MCQGIKWKERGLVAQGQLERAWLLTELIPRNHLATWQDLKKQGAHVHWDSSLL